jgi:transposase
VSARNACRAREDIVVQSPAPVRLIEGGEATVAHVLASDTPTMCRSIARRRAPGCSPRPLNSRWPGRTCRFHLRPVHERILANLKSSTKLFADEKTASVLDPGRGRTKTGQLWAYARDDRPWGGTDPPAVAYVYTPDRTSSRRITHLVGFKGILQVDGYAGYRALAGKGDVTLAFWWAHLRHRFSERAVAGVSPTANEALQLIATLYRIETDSCQPLQPRWLPAAPRCSW